MPVEQLMEMPQHVVLVEHGCLELVGKQHDPGAGFAGGIGCHEQFSSLRLTIPPGGHHCHESPAVPAELRHVPPLGLGIEAVGCREAQDLADAADVFTQVLPQEANSSGADARPDGFQLERFQIRPLNPQQLVHAVENVSDAGQTSRLPCRRTMDRLRHVGAPMNDGVPHVVGGVHRCGLAGEGVSSPQPAPQSIDVSGERVQERTRPLPGWPHRSEGAPAVGRDVA